MRQSKVRQSVIESVKHRLTTQAVRRNHIDEINEYKEKARKAIRAYKQVRDEIAKEEAERQELIDWIKSIDPTFEIQ